MAFPVWSSVRSSSVSSSVPNPPGSDTNAELSLIIISFRVKKYFMATTCSLAARVSLRASSNGSRMLTPRARSGPAPSAPAAMIPGPAPVITIHPRSASSAARSRAWA